MNIAHLILILLSVGGSVAGQTCLKLGMASMNHTHNFASLSLNSVITVASNLYVLVGLSLYFLSALPWLIVLTKVELSRAYPFISLGIVATLLISYWLFDEPLSSAKFAGVLLIMGGLSVIAWSK